MAVDFAKVRFRTLRCDGRGAVLAEYALVIALVLVACAAAIAQLSFHVSTTTTIGADVLAGGVEGVSGGRPEKKDRPGAQRKKSK